MSNYMAKGDSEEPPSPRGYIMEAMKILMKAFAKMKDPPRRSSRSGAPVVLVLTLDPGAAKESSDLLDEDDDSPSEYDN